MTLVNKELNCHCIEILVTRLSLHLLPSVALSVTLIRYNIYIVLSVCLTENHANS